MRFPSRNDLFVASVYIEMISFVVCLGVFIPSYPTTLIDTEPYKTIARLSYNPVMQTLLVITFAYGIILVIYDHEKVIKGNNDV